MSILSELKRMNEISVGKTEQIKYPECKKGDEHVGELLNLVCLEPECLSKSVICGMCYDQQHKSHKIKPLKAVINSSKKYLGELTPMNIDAGKIKASLSETKAKVMQNYEKFSASIQNYLESVKNSINAIFTKLADQIELKAGSNDELIKALEEVKDQQIEHDRFMTLMKKLLAGVPIETDNEAELSGQDIEDTVKRLQEQIKKDLEKEVKDITDLFTRYTKKLQKIIDRPALFESKLDLKFSSTLKHNGINVVSDKIIKSVEAYNYHFGLLEPSIQESGNKPATFAFKINENISNWLAVGICYKNVVVSNSYMFNYSSLGHGGYLISSNGGSWSSIDATKNNVVNSFNFAKDDIIIVTYDPDENKVIFKKKNTEETHTLEFESKEDDELYLCGLFYYNNDEIQFLGYYED